MGFEKAGYDFTPAKFIDDGEDALFVKFPDTGKTVKYVPERRGKRIRTKYREKLCQIEYMCSECGFPLYSDHDSFCSECGAKVVS